MSTVYQIRNWRSTFENNKSRTIERCGYVCIPNKQDGMGLAAILSLPDGAAIFGVWCLIVEAASRQGKHRDGWLTADGHREGTAWTPSDMAVLWRCQEALISRALEVLTSPRVGWILATEIGDFTESVAPTGHQPDTKRPSGALEQNRTEQKISLLSPARKPANKNEVSAVNPVDSVSDPQVTSPTLEEVKAFANGHGISPDCAEKYWNDRMSVGWLKKGQPIRRWQNDLVGYATNWRANEFQRGKGHTPAASPQEREQSRTGITSTAGQTMTMF